MRESDGLRAPAANDIFKRLAAYASDLERTSPPVFVGRQLELAKLGDAVERVALRNPRSMTRIVQGVPGAGKSSLCDEFLASVQGQRIGDRRVLCAKLHPSDLDLPPLSLVAKLTEVLPKELALLPSTGRFAPVSTTLRKMASTVLQVGFRTSEYRIHNETHGLTESSDLGTCIGSYSKHMWPPDALVVLAFDEMQNCPLTERAVSTFQMLNECLHDSCIFVVCFGLQNTAAVIREGLKQSRVPKGAIMEIGPLQPGEGRQVLEATLDHLGVTTEEATWREYVESAGFDGDCPWNTWLHELVDRLEAQSGDFPQHLTAALRSLCLALVEHRETFATTYDMLAAIAEFHESEKADYYEQRLGSSLNTHVLALGAICKKANSLKDGAVPRATALAVFEVGDDNDERVDHEAAIQLLETAEQRGILRKRKIRTKDHFLPPPIPSMATYLASAFDDMFKEGDRVALAIAERCGIGTSR